MKKSFFVKIYLPEGLGTSQRELFSGLVLRLAARFSFQGMDDWQITLDASDKVLGVESEFHDLVGRGKMNAQMLVHFAIKRDAISFREILRESFADIKITGPYQLAPKDWMKAWRKHYRKQVIRAGTKKITIVPAWLKSPTSGFSVRIYPGQAFGTGTHPTTRLCLQAFLKAFSPTKKFTCLDFGAGTGILALSAAKIVGRGFAGDAVESDPVALAQARKNARLNRVSLRFFKKIPKRKYDFVFANVLAPVLLNQRETLQAAVAPGGYIVLSGLLAKEADEFLQAFLLPPFTLAQRWEEGDWAALLLLRRP